VVYRRMKYPYSFGCV